MKKRILVNALASLIIAAGAFAISGSTPAEAATFDGCDDYQAAKTESMMKCMMTGGSSFTSSGWCTSNSYYLETNCAYEPY